MKIKLTTVFSSCTSFQINKITILELVIHSLHVVPLNITFGTPLCTTELFKQIVCEERILFT